LKWRFGSIKIRPQDIVPATHGAETEGRDREGVRTDTLPKGLVLPEAQATFFQLKMK